MKHRKTLLAGLALLVGAGVWIGLAWPRPLSPYAALKGVAPGETNSQGEVVGVGVFWMTNLSNRRIHMNASFVEVKEDNQWHIFTNVVPWDLRELGPYASGYASIVPPHGLAPWRVHVWVSAEVHGLEALPSWLRLYSDRRTRQRLTSRVGWRVWEWPPFGRSVTAKVAGKAFELISEEINPDEKGR